MIGLDIQSPSLNRLRVRYQQAPSIVSQELRTGMEKALDATREAVAERTPVRSGELLDSLYTRLEGGGGFFRGEVGFRAPHAKFVEEGTPPHEIRARQAKVLRFVVGGRVIFRRKVQHPGTQGAWMLRDGMRAAKERTQHIFRARLGQVTRRLGSG